MASEKLPYTKYSPICKLEAMYGMTLGNAYLNNNAGKEFIHYIAKSKQNELPTTVDKVTFFSLLT